MIFLEQPPSFQSFQFFFKLVYGKKGDWLDCSRELLKKLGNDNRSIKILDTFMSDSYIHYIMEEMLNSFVDRRFEIKILLLVPFSQFAELRAKALKMLSPIERINKTLFKIKEKMHKKKQHSSHEQEVKYQRKKSKAGFIDAQLDDIHQMGCDFKLKIKFYELLTKTSIYIISHFVVKGFILSGRSFINNLWLLFVHDEVANVEDLYTYFNQNFDSMWQVAKDYPNEGNHYNKKQNSKTKILSSGCDKFVKLEIENFLEKDLGMEITPFNRLVQNCVKDAGKTKKLVDNCSSMLIALSKEDQNQLGESKTLKNAKEEITICLGTLGEADVVFLIEEKIYPGSKPDNRDIVPMYFSKESVNSAFGAIRSSMKK